MWVYLDSKRVFGAHRNFWIEKGVFGTTWEFLDRKRNFFGPYGYFWIEKGVFGRKWKFLNRQMNIWDHVGIFEFHDNSISSSLCLA